MLVMPGMPVMVGGKKRLGFVGSSTAATFGGSDTDIQTPINLPAGALPGDSLVLFVTAVGGADNQGIQDIAGWTTVDSSIGSTTGMADYKLLIRMTQAGDTSWNIRATNARNIVGTMHAWRNSAGLGNRQPTRSIGDVAGQITSTTAGSAMSVFAHFNDSNSNTLPSVTDYPVTTTFANSQSQGGLYAALHWSGYELELPGGATGTRTFVVTDNDRSIFILQEILGP